MENISKRARSANYSEREKQLVFSLVFKYKNIIENKKTDAVTIQEKRTVWDKIASQFNSCSPGLIHRTPDSLRKFYENKKKEIRKDMAQQRCEVYKTGGGPPPVPKKTEDDILLSIVNKKTIFGLENPVCDGDTLPQYSKLSDDEVNIRDDNNQDKNKNTQEQECVISNTKRSLEENHWENSYSKRVKDCHNDEMVLELQREVDNSEKDGAEVQNTEHISMKKASKGINQEQIGHSHRRRPATVVKALTSSNIAEKYDQLLDKRLLVCNYEIAKLKNTVENYNTEHKLRAQSLRLDIEIKKKTVASYAGNGISGNLT